MAFLWGESMGPEELGKAMLALRCARGMHLDMNSKHTGFEFYRPFAPGVRRAPARARARRDRVRGTDRAGPRASLPRAPRGQDDGAAALPALSRSRPARLLLPDAQAGAARSRSSRSAASALEFSARRSAARRLAARIRARAASPAPTPAGGETRRAASAAGSCASIRGARIAPSRLAPTRRGRRPLAAARRGWSTPEPHGPVALYATRVRGLLRYAIGEPPQDAVVMLRGSGARAPSAPRDARARRRRRRLPALRRGRTRGRACAAASAARGGRRARDRAARRVRGSRSRSRTAGTSRSTASASSKAEGGLALLAETPARGRGDLRRRRARCRTSAGAGCRVSGYATSRPVRRASATPEDVFKPRSRPPTPASPPRPTRCSSVRMPELLPRRGDG